MFFLQFKSRSGSRRDIEYVSGSTALNISIDKLFLLSTNWSQKVFFLHPGGNPAFNIILFFMFLSTFQRWAVKGFKALMLFAWFLYLNPIFFYLVKIIRQISTYLYLFISLPNIQHLIIFIKRGIDSLAVCFYFPSVRFL